MNGCEIRRLRQLGAPPIDGKTSRQRILVGFGIACAAVIIGIVVGAA